jgi:uncharacterized peroxidase-related enzyme
MRFEVVKQDNAPEESRPLLEGVKKAFGMIPNIFGVIAQSPVALKSVLSQFEILGQGLLKDTVPEAIALRIGQLNGCQYCLAAHSAKAVMLGASEELTLQWRRGESDDAQLKAILKLTELLSAKRGKLSDAELSQAREAGLSDGEILEVLANVVLNIFTNSLNELAQTKIDFPAAPDMA